MTSQLADMNAIILAGGLGTRLRSVVSDVPKPMAAVDGRPFLEHQLGYLEGAGLRKVIISTGFMGHMIQDHFGENWQGLELRYSQEQMALGTGGAMIKALKLITNDRPTLVMNGDTYFPVSLNQMLAEHQRRSAAISIAMFETDEQNRYSSFEVGEDGVLSAGKNGSSPYKSGGVYMMSPRIIADLQAYEEAKLSFEDDLTPAFFTRSLPMFAYLEAVPFIDIGIPEDYRRAADVISAHSQIGV